MVEPKTLWIFLGYVTEAGGKPVQDWYWNDLSIDERDAVRLRIGYLSQMGRHLWKEPHFKNLGEISEFRKRVSRGPLRIYGHFSGSNVFVLLCGTVKKKNDDKEGKQVARSRLSKLNQGTGSTHGFEFEESPPPADSKE